MTTPVVFFITGWEPATTAPIIVPPWRRIGSSIEGPPQASTNIPMGVPMGTLNVVGVFTAPAIVVYRHVTGSRAAARAIWARVPTLWTTTPTSGGIPP